MAGTKARYNSTTRKPGHTLAMAGTRAAAKPQRTTMPAPAYRCGPGNSLPVLARESGKVRPQAIDHPMHGYERNDRGPSSWSNAMERRGADPSR